MTQGETMAMNSGFKYLPLFPTIGIDRHDTFFLFGDIAMETGIRNASPCTARDCKWPKKATMGLCLCISPLCIVSLFLNEFCIVAIHT